MGKVRIDAVKRLARNLYNRYPNYFSAEFNENKERLRTILLTPSKSSRNRVAGYLTHLVKVRTRVNRGEEERAAFQEEGMEEESR
jgi:small subunit ribosomal protein S17e